MSKRPTEIMTLERHREIVAEVIDAAWKMQLEELRRWRKCDDCKTCRKEIREAKETFLDTLYQVAIINE